MANRRITDASCVEFLEKLASAAPTPGGGGASALAGALGVALGGMVGSLTLGKKRYAQAEPEVRAILGRAEALRGRLVDLVTRDEEVFLPLSRAYGLPKGTPEQAAERDRVLEAALADACEAPLQIMEAVSECVGLLERLSQIGARIAISDAGVGAALCRAALEGASLNVFINTALMKDRARAQAFEQRADALLQTAAPRAEAVARSVAAGIRKSAQ